jgi:hypothetical protein
LANPHFGNTNRHNVCVYIIYSLRLIHSIRCWFLEMKQEPKWRRLSNELALITTCGLWIVHRARIHRIYNFTAVTVVSLWAEWSASLREIMLAKRRTLIEHGTLTKFCARWRHLLRFVESASMA